MPSPAKRVPAARRTATKASAKPSGQKSLEVYISHQPMKRPASSPTVTSTPVPSQASQASQANESTVKRQKHDAIIPSSSTTSSTSVRPCDASTTCEHTSHHPDSVASTTCSEPSRVADLDVQSSQSNQFLDHYIILNRVY